MAVKPATATRDDEEQNTLPGIIASLDVSSPANSLDERDVKSGAPAISFTQTNARAFAYPHTFSGNV